MGYASHYFDSHVDTWLRRGWLPPGGRLVEFGAQEFNGDAAEARAGVAKFLRKQGKTEQEIARAVGNGTPLVADIFRALGIDYTAVDVDGAFNSTFFDLNTHAPPLEWRDAFDFVNNEGTIEHLINPINAVLVAHELLKVGGAASHSMPLTGCRDHGLIYPTVKFWCNLMGENRYELLRADIFISESPLDFVDARFTLCESNGAPIADPGARKVTDAWLRLVYRKTQPCAFVALLTISFSATPRKSHASLPQILRT
jgi:hypothetical protein